MKSPPNYRHYQRPMCMNCKHYIGSWHGYLLQDECEIYHVLVAAYATCDEFEEKPKYTEPVEIKDWLKCARDNDGK